MRRAVYQRQLSYSRYHLYVRV